MIVMKEKSMNSDLTTYLLTVIVSGIVSGWFHSQDGQSDSSNSSSNLFPCYDACKPCRELKNFFFFGGVKTLRYDLSRNGREKSWLKPKLVYPGHKNVPDHQVDIVGALVGYQHDPITMAWGKAGKGW